MIFIWNTSACISMKKGESISSVQSGVARSFPSL